MAAHRHAPVTLRRAGDADADLLLQWRNDPEAVRFSVSGRAVTAEEHTEWLSRHRGDTAMRLWIAQEGSARVGQVRVDVRQTTGTVSIAVAPDHRGRGVGLAMLLAMVDAVAADPAILSLTALVHPDNGASLRLFERAGFRRLADSESGFAVLERALGR